jgi:hypothetical protein
MHRGKIGCFALVLKAEGRPLPNPAVDDANEFHYLLTPSGVFFVENCQLRMKMTEILNLMIENDIK